MCADAVVRGGCRMRRMFFACWRVSRGSMIACVSYRAASGHGALSCVISAISFRNARVSSSSQAVEHVDAGRRIHEAEVGARPGRRFVRVAPATHVQVRLPVVLAQGDGHPRHADKRKRIHPIHDPSRRTALLALDANQESRLVDQEDDWDVEGVAQHEEAA